ncbi:MAG: Heparinase II/III-like protein [Paenibacillus sp.]|nr:Heparinase II/III-like protein [Paenibacillus sp.]
MNTGTAGGSEAEHHTDIRVYADKWAVMGAVGGSAATNDSDMKQERLKEAQLGGFVTAFHHRPATPDTQARLTFDSECLYIEADGDAGQQAAEEETVFMLLAAPGDYDAFYSISVVITGGPHAYSIGYNNWAGAELADSRQTFRTLGVNDGVRTTVAKGEQGSWKAVVSIPLTALRVPDVREDSEWRFNMIRYFGPESVVPLSSWIPIRTGTVRMDDNRRPLRDRVFRLDLFVANEGRLGAVFAGKPPGICIASSAAMLYEGFTEKTIRFAYDAQAAQLDLQRLRIVWIDPKGRQTVISSVKMFVEGGKADIRFVHPAPSEDGLYRIRLTVESDQAGQDGFAIFAFDRCDLIAAGERANAATAANAAAAGVSASVVKKRRIALTAPSEQVLFLTKLIPDNVGFFAAGVPHRPMLGFRSTNYTWSPDSPSVITSIDEDNVAYPNDRYPESNKLTVINKQGKRVEYPYYEDGQGRRYFLSAHLWHLQRRYAIAETGKLASIDPLGAARLLLRFAQAYEGWVRFNDSVWVQHPVPGDAPPPYPYFGGMWDRWSLMDVYRMIPLLEAFQEVDRTNAWELLSGEAGEDVRTRIIDGMLRPSLESVLTYPILQHNVEYGNWLGMIELGKALGEPQYVHEAAERMAKFVQSSYLADGFWKEITLSYHRQTYDGLIQTIKRLEGWSDPHGYLCSRDGARYAGPDAYAARSACLSGRPLLSGQRYVGVAAGGAPAFDRVAASAMGGHRQADARTWSGAGAAVYVVFAL